FSVLQSTIGIPDLVSATAKLKLPAVAMTDHGNMMGAFHFVNQVINHNKGVVQRRKLAEESGETAPNEQEITPILGCEFNVCENHREKSYKDNGYQVVFLAKNKNGYH